MKKLIIFFLAYAGFASAFGQQVGIGTSTPLASAMPYVTSTTKGLLVPGGTLANRQACPANGLLIYQTNNTPGAITSRAVPGKYRLAAVALPCLTQVAKRVKPQILRVQMAGFQAKPWRHATLT